MTDETLVGLIIVGFAVVFLTVISIFVVSIVRRRNGGLNAESQRYITAHWYRILDSFHMSPSHAIIDADKLLNYCLLQKGVPDGLPLGDKLKKVGKKYFSDLNGVWEAHKLRNQIAHELNFHLSVEQGRGALQNYKKALMDLGAILK